VTGTSASPAGRLLEINRCQICGSDRASTRFEDPPYKVVRCDDCSMVWVTPRFDDEALRAVYGEDYWQSDSPKTKGYSDYAKDADLYLKTFRRRHRLVRRYLPQGKARILDVGCAAGYFLRVMAEKGHEVRGVEVSEAIDSVPANKPGYDKGSFDLVTMWDVIEHVPDPKQLLEEAKAMLRPDGHLILETQNVDSRFATLLGLKWHHFKHQEHIFHFNPDTVRRVLEQAGFEVVKLTSSFGGKYVSFDFIAERAARLNRAASLALRPLTLLRGANVYLNFHDEMVVVARIRRDARSTA
jgi:SAM-dependent methyltransferase